MVHFSNFWGQKKFSQKIWLCHEQLDNSFKYNVKIKRNLMTQFQETPQQKGGWKDRQTLFHSTFPATARGPTNKTAVDWHLKVKDIEYNADLTKN